ncbi:MAG TPA: hypothetical protein VMS89_03730, partial [Methanoregulaceae archaeon]|nr:hypothetical protein [Methanoregulaceae archaeon]
DLEAAIRFCRPFGKITVVGHSLGGRLALLSNVDYCIAISPSLSKKYSEQTREMLKVMRSYRVRPSDIMNLLTLQEELPVWKAEHHKGEVLILYAERDAPEISEGCQLLKNKGTQVIRIEKAMHSDVFLVKQTFVTIREQIRKWYDNTIVD